MGVRGEYDQETFMHAWKSERIDKPIILKEATTLVKNIRMLGSVWASEQPCVKDRNKSNASVFKISNQENSEWLGGWQGMDS